MKACVVREPDLRKLLLSAVGFVAVALPIVSGLLNPTQTRAYSQAQATPASEPVYEVVSIKPNKSGSDWDNVRIHPNEFTATNIKMLSLIQEAFGVKEHQISGAPGWLNSERYDVEAKMDSSVADELRKLNRDQRKVKKQRMLQALLADRLKLTLHRESKELPVYALVIAKNGPKLQEARPGDAYPNGIKGTDCKSYPGMISVQNGIGGRLELRCQAVPVAELVELLSDQLHHTTLDKTELTGKYDITLQWTPDENQGAMFNGTESGQPGTAATSTPESSGPSIFTAIQEQLGLKLESQKGPVEILVIDHVEKPSEN